MALQHTFGRGTTLTLHLFWPHPPHLKPDIENSYAKLSSSMLRVFFTRLERIHRIEPGLYLPRAHSQVLLRSAPTSALLPNISCSVARLLSFSPFQTPRFCYMQSFKLWASRLASLLPTVLEKNETMYPECLLHPMSEAAPAQWNQGGV